MCSTGQQSFNSRGFTLIELLVVIAIVSALVGLVGSFTADAINKYKYRANQLYIQAIFNNAGQKAFVLEQQLTVEVHDNIVVLKDEGGNKLNSYQLDGVSFSNTSIVIDRFGSPAINLIQYRFNGRDASIRLSEKP